MIYPKNLTDRFLQRVAADENQNIIIYSPFCTKLDYLLTKSDVVQMLECLAELVRLGIVHRDLSPAHFMRAKNADGTDGRIVLIDFGAAVFVEPQDAPLNISTLQEENWHKKTYRGSLEFAADEILQFLATYAIIAFIY